jgi:alpha-N-acetylglucosaminidase
MLQGWLFYSLSTFWTNDAIRAFLSDVPNTDIIILDLFSESQPQWQRFFGKPFIWCQLHDYGGNQGLYGQVENVTVNAIAALGNASNMIGMGLTMEGQEGNEIM